MGLSRKSSGGNPPEPPNRALLRHSLCRLIAWGSSARGTLSERKERKKAKNATHRLPVDTSSRYVMFRACIVSDMIGNGGANVA